MQHYQHLVLLALHYALTQSCKQYRIILGIHFRIHLGQLGLHQVLVDMYGWLAPVVCAPRHVDTHAECVVRQYLVEVAARFGFKYGLGAGSGIGGTRLGFEHLQFLHLRQQRIGVALVAV